MNQKNLKYRHVYVVVRVDMSMEESAPGDAVVVTKVFPQEVDAELEADRLNELNAKKGCIYVVRTGRLVTD